MPSKNHTTIARLTTHVLCTSTQSHTKFLHAKFKLICKHQFIRIGKCMLWWEHLSICRSGLCSVVLRVKFNIIILFYAWNHSNLRHVINHGAVVDPLYFTPSLWHYACTWNTWNKMAWSRNDNDNAAHVQTYIFAVHQKSNKSVNTIFTNIDHIHMQEYQCVNLIENSVNHTYHINIIK